MHQNTDKETCADQDIEGRLAFLGLDETSRAQIRELESVIERELPKALDRFYDTVRKTPETRKFFSSDDHMRGAKKDLLATIRVLHAHLLTQQQPLRLLGEDEPADVEVDRPTLVMVVDDSVTVRKVTSRLLERNGMNVLTAKDGVDAITQLQERKPDIILLDIEMPRMDGFEVATLVRHDEHLKELPIVMITSRTGEKHRDRAMAIGVNEYLGKPYQESLLLETIQRLVTRHE